MFRSYFIFEIRRLFIKRNLLILFVLALLAIYFTIDGISDYRSVSGGKEPFQKNEKERIPNFLNYTQYGTRGVRLLYLPAPISIFFNDMASFQEMMAHIDTAEKLDVSNSLKGKDLFSKTGGYMDFAGIMLLLGTFVALLYGYEVTSQKKFLVFLADVTGKRHALTYTILSRVLLINIVFSILSLFVLLILLIAGIPAANVFFVMFIIGLILLNTIFVILGALTGILKKQKSRIMAISAIYFLLVLFIPWMLQKSIYMDAKLSLKSIYSYEYSTFKMITDFEQRALKAVGVYKSGTPVPEDVKKIVYSGQDVEYKKLREMETDRINKLEKVIEKYEGLSTLFPTTFYISLNRELSSKGYRNVISFYRYAYEMRQEFIEFYIKRKFFMPLPKNGVESFVKGNENLFEGKSGLPFGFIPGIIFGLVWIVALFVLLQVLTNRPAKQEAPVNKKEANLALKKGQTVVFVHPGAERVLRLIALFCKKEKTIRVTGWGCLPDNIKVKWIFFLLDIPMSEKIKGIGDRFTETLEPELKAGIILEILKPTDAGIIIFNNFMEGLTDEFLEEYKSFLGTIKQGKSIVYFCNSLIIASSIGDEFVRFTDDKSI